MARLSKVLLGLWLAGMFASGSALAALREIDLGLLSPGDAVGLFGKFPLGVQSTDIYEFDLGGAPINTVGASVVSLLTTPGNAVTFDITTELVEWNGVAFQTVPGTIGTGGAVVLHADLPPGAESDHHNQFNRRYELTITGEPTGTGIATYGGSLAVVPEPSMAVLLIGGFLSIALLSRRRLTASAV